MGSEAVDLAPFLASLEKLGMFGIAGFLVWHMVKNNDALIAQIRDMVAKWSENSDKTLEVLKEIDMRMERSEKERTELIQALSHIRQKERGNISISASVIMGLVLLATLLGWHSTVVMNERDKAIKERNTAVTNFNVAHTHEQELQASLFANEVTMRKLEADAKAAAKGITNAKPNNCTDAPVAADIDAILRQQSAATRSSYLPRTGIEIGAALYPEMGRQNQPRPSAVLCGSTGDSAGVRSGQGRS